MERLTARRCRTRSQELRPVTERSRREIMRLKAMWIRPRYPAPAPKLARLTSTPAKPSPGLNGGGGGPRLVIVSGLTFESAAAQRSQNMVQRGVAERLGLII